jgi:hypothetical protein
VDKLTDIALSITSIIALLPNPTLAAINAMVLLWKLYFHKESQFKPWRASPEEQVELIAKAVLEDETSEYLTEKNTSAAASSDWKKKTILQLVAWFWIPTIALLSNKSGLNLDILQVILTILNWASLYYAHKSANWKTKLKNQKN